MKRVTVLSELRAEFSELIERLLKVVAAFTSKNPKVIFCAMVTLMIASVVLCFTLFRIDSAKMPKQTKVFQEVGGNLGEIGTMARELKRVIEIKAALEVLLAKDSLNTRDSVLMEQMLQEIDKSMTSKKK